MVITSGHSGCASKFSPVGQIVFSPPNKSKFSLGCVASGLQSSSAQARDGEQGEGCGWEGDQAGPQGRCRDCEVVVGEGG